MALPAVIVTKRMPLSERVELILDHCRAKGLRRTNCLRAIFEALLQYERPIGWADLTTNPQLLAACDPSSVFRILTRLEKLGVVHRLAAAQRSYYFVLNIEGRHYDQIVCTSCGRAEIFPRDHPLESFTNKVHSKTHYKGIYHQLTFYGVCPQCQETPRIRQNSKLRVDSQ
jgi:Fur family ferric uptake transcriptional regulator